MKKYSSNYPQRNAFNEALYETVEEFLQEIDIRPSDTVLAVNSKTLETKNAQENFEHFKFI